MHIRLATETDQSELLRLRIALWPDDSDLAHEKDIREYFAGSHRLATFVAQRPDGRLGGFLEANLRDYADGCATRPVGYIEGWYVDADLRRQGIGGRLVAAAEAWAREQGCREMASDCHLHNSVSLKSHTALGYATVERLIHFRKEL